MEDDRDTAVVFNAEQAARRLAISVNSLRRLARQGDIPTVQYAGRTLFRREDLDEFIDSHTVEA